MENCQWWQRFSSAAAWVATTQRSLGVAGLCIATRTGPRIFSTRPYTVTALSVTSRPSLGPLLKEIPTALHTERQLQCRAAKRSGGGGLTGRILWPTPCDRRTVAVPVPIRAPLWTGCERSRGGHTDHLPPGIRKRGCSSQRCDTATWQRASSRARMRQTAACWACQHIPVGSDRGSH